MAYKIQRFFKICIPKYIKYELYSSKVIGKYVKSFYQ